MSLSVSSMGVSLSPSFSLSHRLLKSHEKTWKWQQQVNEQRIMKRTVKVVRRCHFLSISSLPVFSFISILVSRQITSSFFSTVKPIIHPSSGQWSASSFMCLRHEPRTTSWTIRISRRRCTFYVENEKNILSSIHSSSNFSFHVCITLPTRRTRHDYCLLLPTLYCIQQKVQ